MDWLSKLHYRFKMSPETLFTVVSYVDQYLQVRSPALPELQLLGVAALLVGSKIEETYQVPHLKQLISCCAYQYTASQILAKED